MIPIAAAALTFITATANCSVDAQHYMVAENDQQVCIATMHRTLKRAEKFSAKHPEYSELYFVDASGAFYKYAPSLGQ